MSNYNHYLDRQWKTKTNQLSLNLAKTKEKTQLIKRNRYQLNHLVLAEVDIMKVLELEDLETDQEVKITKRQRENLKKALVFLWQICLLQMLEMYQVDLLEHHQLQMLLNCCNAKVKTKARFQIHPFSNQFNRLHSSKISKLSKYQLMNHWVLLEVKCQGLHKLLKMTLK